MTAMSFVRTICGFTTFTKELFMFKSAYFLVVGALLTGCSMELSAPGASDEAKTPLLFDDFSYSSSAEFSANGWLVRQQAGHPGLPGALWDAQGVTFLAASAETPAGALRLSASTDGSGINTRQVQICHQRKYKMGTYAARVLFRDSPAFGPDGDVVIQTFYAISPLQADLHPDYSEADFEYLPNGGWGQGNTAALWATSWETFQLNPWTAVNEHSRRPGSQAGWHTLVLQVTPQQLRYFVDGELFATHSSQVVPEDWMSINFNLWFMANGADGNGGPVAATEMRQYQQDIDWVMFVADQQWSPAQIEQQLLQVRRQGHRFIDSVPRRVPAGPTDCGL